MAMITYLVTGIVFLIAGYFLGMNYQKNRRIKKPLNKYPKDKKIIVRSWVANWVNDKKETTDKCHYVMYYYPHDHEIKLECSGLAWDQHDSYLKYVYPWYIKVRIILESNNREEMIQAIINYVSNKDPKSISLKKETREEKILRLEKEIEDCIEKEDFLKVVDLRKQLDELNNE